MKYCTTLFLAITAYATFAQISLKEVILKAGVNNGLLKVERYNVSLSESDILTASLRFNPFLNNQTLFLTNSKYYPEGYHFGTAPNRQVWVQLTSRFQVAGQRNYKMEYAKRNYDLSKSSYDDLQRNLYNDVANKWLDTWHAYANFAITSNVKKNVDSLLLISENRLKNQVIAYTDFSRIKILSQQYQIFLNTEEQKYFKELKRLTFLMGNPNDTSSINLNDPLLDKEFIQNIDSIINVAIIERSDIRTIKLTNEAAKINISLQKSLAYPIPEVGFIYNPQNFPGTLDIYQYFGSYAILPLPLFDRNQGFIQKSIVLRNQSDLMLTAKQSRIKKEVLAAFQLLQLQKEILLLSQSIVKQSEQVLTNIQYSYVRGGVPFIDYLNAQGTYYDSQKAYLESLYEYRKRNISFLFVTGLISQL